MNLLVAISRIGSAARLADLAATSPAYLSQIKNRVADSKSGTPKAMGDELARRIETAIHVPLGWMDSSHHMDWVNAGLVESVATGSGAAPPAPPEAGAKPADLLEPVAPLSTEDAGRLLGGGIGVQARDDDDPAFTHIPKVKLRLSAGISGFETEPERFDGTTTTVPTSWIERHGYSRRHLIATLVKGESMETTLYDGDLVIINLADTRLVDGGLYAINYGGEPVIKRMTRDAGQWWLTSDHRDQQRYYRRVCSGTDCIIVGRVVKRESERL
ncbi:S24 family peptidase [Massilia timonae]|uniref:S24 family peptidase n=1 Tax=Massilia timonae TaxID=47229 RepID=UPI0008F5F325|nr:S24 family peptidase [Massilia timonae]